MTDYLRDDFGRAAIGSSWDTDANFVLADGALRISAPGATPSYIFHGTAVAKGNAQAEASVRLVSGSSVILVLSGTASGAPAYEFEIDHKLDGTNSTAKIYKRLADGRTQLASAALTITAAMLAESQRIKVKVEGAGYHGADGPVSLSLYWNDEATATLTYTDSDMPFGRSSLNYLGIGSANINGSDDVFVDSVSLRRLMEVEIERRYVAAVWTWDRLADNALIRLARGGNPQFSKTTMFEFLGFAEMEIADKCGDAYWLTRAYTLSTSSFENTLPAWISDIESPAVYEGESKPIPIIPRQEFNWKNAGRDATGTPHQIVNNGMSDDGRLVFYVYPTPTSSIDISLWVRCQPGYIEDSYRTPLIPPRFVETLVFGALRRAMSYDTSPRAWKENEHLWQEGRKAILRDNSKKNLPNARLLTTREAYGVQGRPRRAGVQRWRNPD